MNVVQVVPRYPPRTGGVETHVSEISERLHTRGHDVTVLTADAGDTVERTETRKGVQVVRHRGAAPGGAFHVAPGILWTLRRLDPDVVHAHNYHSLPLLFAAVAAGSVQLISTPHYHGESASPFRDVLLSAYRPAGGWALQQSDAVVAVSEWERERLKEDFDVDVTVIPNGIEVGRFRDVAPRHHGQPYLLTVGRLEEYKGVQHAIRALKNLPNHDLLVAGTGPYREELGRVADDAEVSDRVEFLGYVDDDDLPALYAGSDALITMSSFESFGITVGEALAAGTPCVVRNCGGLTDWARRSECVEVSNIHSEAVAMAVDKIRGCEPTPENLPKWEETVDALEALYVTA